MRRVSCSVVVLASAALVLGCAARRPVLYPNQHLDRVGQVTADRDVEECKQLASSRGASSADREAAREAAQGTTTGAAIGAAGGAAGGAVYGSAGRGAAAGAAGGAAAGLLNSLFRLGGPSAAYKSFVNACLADRGYQVVGWE